MYLRGSNWWPAAVWCVFCRFGLLVFQGLSLGLLLRVGSLSLVLCSCFVFVFCLFAVLFWRVGWGGRALAGARWPRFGVCRLVAYSLTFSSRWCYPCSSRIPLDPQIGRPVECQAPVALLVCGPQQRPECPRHPGVAIQSFGLGPASLLSVLDGH